MSVRVCECECVCMCMSVRVYVSVSVLKVNVHFLVFVDEEDAKQGLPNNCSQLDLGSNLLQHKWPATALPSHRDCGVWHTGTGCSWGKTEGHVPPAEQTPPPPFLSLSLFLTLSFSPFPPVSLALPVCVCVCVYDRQDMPRDNRQQFDLRWHPV